MREEKEEDGHLDYTVSLMETMFESIQASNGKLFFVYYTREDILRPRWYIVPEKYLRVP